MSTPTLIERARELRELATGTTPGPATAYREHRFVDEDRWFSCPKAEGGCLDRGAGRDCNCPADEHNAILDALADKLGIPAEERRKP